MKKESVNIETVGAEMDEWKEDLLTNIVEGVNRFEFNELFKESFGRYPNGEDFREHGFVDFGNKVDLLKTIRTLTDGFGGVNISIGRYTLVKKGRKTEVYVNNIKVELEDITSNIVNLLNNSVKMGELISPDNVKFYLIHQLDVLGKTGSEILPVILNILEDGVVESLSSNVDLMYEQLDGIVTWLKDLSQDQVAVALG